MVSFLPGVLTGLSLIVAIGAQNAFVLRQGLTGRHVATVVGVCIVVDITLIGLGVAGIGALTRGAPWLVTGLRWGGAAYLLWFAFTSFCAAVRPTGLEGAGSGTTTRSAALRRALAVSLLNPHVYLDTVVMLGTVAAQHGQLGRWWFGAGAALGSLIWFSALGFAARRLSGRLSAPSTWRWIDLVIGIVMTGLALTLLMG